MTSLSRQVVRPRHKEKNFLCYNKGIDYVKALVVTLTTTKYYPLTSAYIPPYSRNQIVYHVAPTVISGPLLNQFTTKQCFTFLIEEL